MKTIARTAMHSAAAAMLAAGLTAAPARAQEGSGSGSGTQQGPEVHAAQLVGVFYNSCVRHLQDNWEGLGQTMQQMGFDADPRPEVRDGLLGESEGDVWSGQSEAGVVYVVFIPETTLCAVEFTRTDADPAALKQRFGEMSDQIYQTMSANAGAPGVERKTDSGQVDLADGSGKMDYISYLLLTDASSLGIYYELAVLPSTDGMGRGHMSISYVPKQGGQGQGQN